jgi:putative oxidoreductase
LFLRLGLGVIFLYHGYGKVFGEGANFGSSWNPSGMAMITQILVAWGEFLCGGAILLGFMTEIAALGIIVIMVGAIVLFTGKNGFNMMNSGFEYNYALITMALALIGTGPGAFKFGCCKKE